MIRGWSGAAGAVGLLVAVHGAAAAAPVTGGYVALGSSYAAGTSLPRVADDSPASCGQGTENYPRQVARALNLKLTDRSCGGAVTDHILRGGHFGLPAQLAPVNADTGLVTVTIGGNDVRFTADLGRFSCLNRAGQGAACGEVPADFDLDRAFAGLEVNLRTLVAELRGRAPRTRIVFVDYVTVAPPDGTCAALGLSAADAAAMRARAVRLAALTAKVAKETGADLIEASRLTAAHHVCAPEPWAWGAAPAGGAAGTGMVPFHPRPKAISAVAAAIVQRLKS